MLHCPTERKRLWLLLELKRQAGFFFLLSFLWKMSSCLLCAQTLIENSKYHIRTTYIIGIQYFGDPKGVSPITPRARLLHVWSQGPVNKRWFPWGFVLSHSSWNCHTWCKITGLQYYIWGHVEIFQVLSRYFWKSHLCKTLYFVRELRNLLFFFQDAVSGWAYDQGFPILQVNSRDMTLSGREVYWQGAFLDKPRIPDKLSLYESLWKLYMSVKYFAFGE